MKKIILNLFLVAITTLGVYAQNDGVKYSRLNGLNSGNVKLSFETFESLKGQLLDISKLNIPTEASRLEQNNYILEEVNEYYDVDIDFDVKLKELNTSSEIFDWLINNSNFNQTDVDILTKFSDNLTSKTFDEAIVLLEGDLSKENVGSKKIEKYQSIVNGIKLIEYQYDGFFTGNVAQKSWGCAWAIAKLALASASLVAACNPPALGATVGAGCYLAGAGFVAASASVGMECGD